MRESVPYANRSLVPVFAAKVAEGIEKHRISNIGGGEYEIHYSGKQRRKAGLP
jgi:hypothetical protein